MERHIDIRVEPVAVRSDAASVERERYAYGSRACVDRHGETGGGATLSDGGKSLKLARSNTTLDNPGIVAYALVDWTRSILHGVGGDERGLRLMPSEDWQSTSACLRSGSISALP